MLYNIDDILQKRPIIVCGSGEYVNRAINATTLDIDYFIDDSTQIKNQNGKPVYSIDKLKEEKRNIVIIIMHRFASRVISKLLSYGYIWNEDIFDGRYFGLTCFYHSSYEVLKCSEDAYKSSNIEIYKGYGAEISLSNIVIPKTNKNNKIKLYVGTDAKLKMDGVVIEELSEFYVGKKGELIIGNGTIVRPECRFSVSTESTMEIGKSVLFNKWCDVQAATCVPIRIGDNCTFGERLVLFGYSSINIGRDCMFSRNIYVSSGAGHDLSINGKKRIPQELIIGDHVWVGFGSTILPGVRIGNGSMIGAGSIVNISLKDNSLAAGNPAKLIHENIHWDRNYSAYKELCFKDGN